MVQFVLFTVISNDAVEARNEDLDRRVHDTMGTRCDPYVDKPISGQNNDFYCHSDLTHAVQPYGLIEFDVHDVLNVFQVSGSINTLRRLFLQEEMIISNFLLNKICLWRYQLRVPICLNEIGARRRTGLIKKECLSVIDLFQLIYMN